MKIAIVGPVEPFRSGVARHTTAFARALVAEGCEVQVFSFSRQYPALLFPGEDQVEPGMGPPSDLAVDYCLDTINPLSWVRTARRIAAFAPDALIVPCWTFFTAPALAHVAKVLARRGIRVIAMVHNPNDHEESGWKQFLLSRQIRAAHGAIAHSGPVRSAVEAIAPRLPVAVYPHPLYDTHPAPDRELPRRAPLELLFFGLVRPYKGLDILLDALELTGGDFHLTIAGEVWSDGDGLARRIAASRHATRIELVPRHVSDQEAANFFARCDVLVAPYRSATGSGVIALSHHYLRPVIASDIEVMREAVTDGETGWLFPSGDAAALARMLATPGLAASAQAMKPAMARLAEERSWQGLARLAMSLAGPSGNTP